MSPTKNDWVSSTFKLLQTFEINLNENEIAQMTRKDFKKLTKQSAIKIAFQNLKNKQANGSKGKKIIYESLKLADYLQPDCQLSVEDKRLMFSLRTEMNEIPSNYGTQTNCIAGCNTILTNIHIFRCEILNNKQTNNLDYTYILNGNINQQIEVLKHMKANIIKMNQLEINLRDSAEEY